MVCIFQLSRFFLNTLIALFWHISLLCFKHIIAMVWIYSSHMFWTHPMRLFEQYFSSSHKNVFRNTPNIYKVANSVSFALRISSMPRSWGVNSTERLASDWCNFGSCWWGNGVTFITSVTKILHLSILLSMEVWSATFRFNKALVSPSICLDWKMPTKSGVACGNNVFMTAIEYIRIPLARRSYKLSSSVNAFW